jgi:flagellar biogenesis protein FliO
VCGSLRRIQAKRQEKALVVRDTASLGEKRFLAVVEVGSERYLIGGSANSVALLASLRDQSAPTAGFSALLEESGTRSVTIQ